MLPHIVVSWELRMPSAFVVGARASHLVGIKFRQEDILSLVENYEKRHIERCYAWLVREPQNPHDSNAVAVYIRQTCVGYLNRKLAALIASDLDELTRFMSGAPASCLATVFKSTAQWTDKLTGLKKRSKLYLVKVIGPWTTRQKRDEDELDDEDDFDSSSEFDDEEDGELR